MGIGYAESPITATCLNQVANNFKPLFPFVNVHTVFSSPTCGQNRTSGIFGCKTSGTENIPISYTFPNTLIQSKKYGVENKTVNLKSYSNVDVYFNIADISSILPRQYCPSPFLTYTSGPSLTTAHCYTHLKSRTNYQDRLNYNFVDSSIQIPDNDLPDDCKTNNWLIFSNPAAKFYTNNITDPFKVISFYEQSGNSPSSDSTKGGNNYMPFCTPITARDQTGVALGQYTGLTFLYKFGQAINIVPFRPYLPYDPYTTIPNTTRVNPNALFYSLEVDVFWRGSNNILGSPLLNRIRYWFYSKAPGGEGQPVAYYDPFALIFKDTGFTYDWSFDLNLNIIGSAQQTITINLSNMQNLVTY